MSERDISNIRYVAKTLRDLTFSQMMDVAEALSDMMTDRGEQFDADKPEHWACLLSDWASSFIEANPEERRT